MSGKQYDKAKAGPKTGKGAKANGSGKLPEALNGKTRDKVGAAVGMSGKQCRGEAVISLNVQRRDLTAGQRAIVGARALPMFEATKVNGRPKKGAQTGHHSKSRDDASKVFKVSKNLIQQAKALLTEALDLVTQVELGAQTIAKGKRRKRPKTYSG
jgi:hypothetical protein